MHCISTYFFLLFFRNLAIASMKTGHCTFDFSIYGNVHMKHLIKQFILQKPKRKKKN